MRVIVHVVFFVLQTVEVPQLQYLDLVVDDFFVQFIEAVDVPVIIQRRGVRRHPCRGANADSLGLPQRFSSCCTLTRWSTFFCAGPAVFECRRGGDRRSPTVAPFCMDTGVAHARRCATTGAVWSMTWRRSSMGFGRSCDHAEGVSCDDGCACRALCTGTGPGLTPAIRAGKGWRGRQELAPRAFCHPN